MRTVRRCLIVIAVVFVLPTLATTGWWFFKERPQSWHRADWTSSGLLADATETPEAAIYLMAARTGGLKGAVSVHSWIVLKPNGADAYERFDMVGWGTPVRRNTQPADGRWYSNEPVIVREVRGDLAETLIPRFHAAIEAFPFAGRGDYRIWPGPNSNSFVAWLLKEVPEFGGRLPPTAIGRDFAPGLVSAGRIPGDTGFEVTLAGLVGFAAGLRSGIEFQFAGLVAGVDFDDAALIVPAYGRIELF